MAMFRQMFAGQIGLEKYRQKSRRKLLLDKMSPVAPRAWRGSRGSRGWSSPGR
jgi:hypothetical protein